MDIEAHRDDPAHATRCAWRRAEEFGIDLSLMWSHAGATSGARLRGLRNFAQFRSAARGTMDLFNPNVLLEALAAEAVDFVIVGGVAATLQGSSYITGDLDIAYCRSPENIDRIVRALSSLHPRLRVAGMTDEEARLLPFRFDAPTLGRGVNFTLNTDVGPIDLLGEVKGVGDYAAAARESDSKDVSGLPMQVLQLESLIRAKRAAGRAKDLNLVPELEAILEMRRTLDEREQEKS